jgi:hypothetical protein
MAQVSLDELENAVIVIDDGCGEAKGWVSRETGMIHLRDNEYMDDEAPLPAHVDNDDSYVPIPGARELGLGHELVFRFAAQHLPGDRETVRELFRTKGAYARFSRLLETRGATDEWHRFRDEETKAALRSWCEGNGLQVKDGQNS